jgi:hypothetical protein
MLNILELYLNIYYEKKIIEIWKLLADVYVSSGANGLNNEIVFAFGTVISHSALVG